MCNMEDIKYCRLFHETFQVLILSYLSGMATSNVKTDNVRKRVRFVMDTKTVATEVMRGARAAT